MLVLLELPNGLAVRDGPAHRVQTTGFVECDGDCPFCRRIATAMEMVAEVRAVALLRLVAVGVLHRLFRTFHQRDAQMGGSRIRADQHPNGVHFGVSSIRRMALHEEVRSAVDDHCGRLCLLRLLCGQGGDGWSSA